MLVWWKKKHHPYYSLLFRSIWYLTQKLWPWSGPTFYCCLCYSFAILTWIKFWWPSAYYLTKYQVNIHAFYSDAITIWGCRITCTGWMREEETELTGTSGHILSILWRFDMTLPNFWSVSSKAVCACPCNHRSSCFPGWSCAPGFLVSHGTSCIGGCPGDARFYLKLKIGAREISMACCLHSIGKGGEKMALKTAPK
jgi:hypothetical protein